MSGCGWVAANTDSGSCIHVFTGVCVHLVLASQVAACRAFCFAIFLNNALDVRDVPIQKSAAAAASDAVWGPLLASIQDRNSHSLILVSEQLHSMVAGKQPACSPTGTTFITEDQEQLACAIADILCCRAFTGEAARTHDINHTNRASAYLQVCCLPELLPLL